MFLKPIIRKLCRKTPILSQTRHHNEWRYRLPGTATQKQILQAELVQGFMWWWILWHFWTDSEHVFGHYPYPYPGEWTDEELGIPRCIEDLI